METDDSAAATHDPAASNRATMLSNLAMQDQPPTAEPDAWLLSVGIFDGDLTINEIWKAGRQIREAERYNE